MKKIHPLGKRKGIGTFDTFYDTEQYNSLESAIENNDVVVIDFVKNKKGVIHFKGYHTKVPSKTITKRLQIQHFPAGIDVADDNIACNIAEKLFKNYKS